jgi:hypothetical protein
MVLCLWLWLSAVTGNLYLTAHAQMEVSRRTEIQPLAHAGSSGRAQTHVRIGAAATRPHHKGPVTDCNRRQHPPFSPSLPLHTTHSQVGCLVSG